MAFTAQAFTFTQLRGTGVSFGFDLSSYKSLEDFLWKGFHDGFNCVTEKILHSKDLNLPARLSAFRRKEQVVANIHLFFDYTPSTCNLCAVSLIRNHQHLQLLHVVDEKLPEASDLFSFKGKIMFFQVLDSFRQADTSAQLKLMPRRVLENVE